MNNKDAEIIKALAELKNKEQELTPEQEHQLFLALNPTERFYHNVESIFSKQAQKTVNTPKRK